MTKCPIKNMVASVHQRLTTIAKDENRPFQDLRQLYASERWLFRLSQSPHRDRFVLKGALLLVAWNLFLGLLMPSCLVAQQMPSDEFRIFDGQPTRLFMTGNSHHPTYGLDKLARLLDRYFDGKSPIVVAGLADGRKDSITQEPIPPAKLTELIRFLEPEFTARAKQPEPRERLVILNYVIVNAPRKEADGAWVKTDADALQAYAQMAIERGAQRVFFSEMVQPNHITGGNFGNKFRREGLRVFDELVRRKLPGIERGPTLQVQMEQQRHFFRDDRHFSDAGRDFIACLWLETLLKHDGRPIPAWLKDEMQTLLNDANAVSEDTTREIESAVRRGLALLDQAGPNWRKHKSCFSCHHQTLPMLAKLEASRVGFPADAAWLKSQADFSHKYFDEHIEIMNEAKHLPGGSFTASYGLWALSLDQRPADETTTAMVTYLLKIQSVVRLEDREPSITAIRTANISFSPPPRPLGPRPD